MNLANTERLLKLLRASGVEYFKSDDLEIRLKAVESPTASPAARPEPAPVIEKPKAIPVATFAPAKKSKKNAGDIAVSTPEIPHQVNEMLSILTMDTEALLDKVFPLPGVQQAAD